MIDKFFHRIEHDRDFFTYYNVEPAQVIQLVHEQAVGYLEQAIELLLGQCTPDVDFMDYDLEVQRFNFQLTRKEEGLLADLMFQVYLSRDVAMLKAFKNSMTPSDLNVFSPSAERNSFMNMVARVKADNEAKISQYIAVDRLTGRYKQIDYWNYNY